MQKNKNQKDNCVLIKVVKEKLDWYISEASDEEYDEAEVEALQQVLDELEPLKEGVMPNVDEAWERFLAKVEERAEEVSKNVAENGAKPKPGRKGAKVVQFVLRHKTIVAAVLLILVLAVSMGVQSEAFQNSGFFMWLKNDETGMQMVTSPDGLDGMTEKNKRSIYFEKTDLPEWTVVWVEIVTSIMENYGYEWKRVEVNEYEDKRFASSHYLCVNEQITMGIIHYTDKVIINTDVYGGYVFDKSIDDMQMYKKIKATGEEEYMISFFEKSLCYFVSGDNMNDVQSLAKLLKREILK